jgi:hypothetical protein
MRYLVPDKQCSGFRKLGALHEADPRSHHRQRGRGDGALAVVLRGTRAAPRRWRNAATRGQPDKMIFVFAGHKACLAALAILHWQSLLFILTRFISSSIPSSSSTPKCPHLHPVARSAVPALA